MIDDRLFSRARGSGSGPDIVTPIVVNDNLLDLVVKPGPEVGAIKGQILQSIRAQRNGNGVKEHA